MKVVKSPPWHFVTCINPNNSAYDRGKPMSLCLRESCHQTGFPAVHLALHFGGHDLRLSCNETRQCFNILCFLVDRRQDWHVGTARHTSLAVSCCCYKELFCIIIIIHMDWHRWIWLVSGIQTNQLDRVQ